MLQDPFFVDFCNFQNFLENLTQIYKKNIVSHEKAAPGVPGSVGAPMPGKFF